MKENTETKPEWVFNGLDKDRKPKFKRPTYESLEEVLEFLDKKKIKYIVSAGRNKSIAIYTRVHKYRYYHTTGKWSQNNLHKWIKRRTKKTYYMSKGIKDFYTRFLLPAIKKEKEYSYIKEVGIRKYGYPKYEYDYIRTQIGHNPSLAREFYLFFYYDKSKYLPFINPDGINWIKDTVEYKKFNKEKTQSKISKILNV